MASTFAVSRNHLIFGLCLPLAVLLGYMLADIQDTASLVVVLLAMTILVTPVLMRWHHALLILSWNMVAQPSLPGHPQLWMLMSLLSLFIAVLNRTINAEHRFAHVPSLTRPLLVFATVVLVTAFMTGGIGLRIFGSSSVGGRGYFYILGAVAGFFALSSRQIPPQQAAMYLGLFFLPGLTAMIGRIAGLFGPGASFLYYLFPPDFVADDFVTDLTYDSSLVRVNGSVAASLAVFSWLLARHGITGVFDLSRPWRLLLLVGSVAAGMFGGFRSALLLMGSIFFILYTIEKLWRTRLTAVMLMLGILTGTVLVAFSTRLPLSVQRSLSILPIEVDPVTREMASYSTEWRIEMWKSLLPQVPKYLLKGKGYALSGDDLYMAQWDAVNKGNNVGYEAAAFAGDYHNGPLSVVIPFGAAGMLAFAWLMAAGARFLCAMCRQGAPEFHRINSFLFALFLARVVVFCTIFGSLYLELYYFTGILGFSVALNVTGRQWSAEAGQKLPGETAAK